MLDIPDPGWGSPIGNSLDHGVGYTLPPLRDHFGAHCGMEVVTPEGDVLRTGMGAVPGSETWQAYRYGVGPLMDGLFAQSNFGIVTKMGFWLMPMPETYMTGIVSVPRYRDFGELIDQVGHLDDLMMTGMPEFSSPARGSGFGGSPALASLMENGWPSTEETERFVTEQGRAAWSVKLAFYGPEESVRGNWAAARRRFAEAIPGATFEDGLFARLPLSPEEAERFPEKAQLGIPALEIFRAVSRNPATNDSPRDGHADLFAIVPRSAEAIHRAARVFADAYREMGLPPAHTPFSTPLCFYSRGYAVAAFIPTWRDAERNAQSRELYSLLLDRLAENGIGVYRTAPAFQDQLASKFSLNDGSLMRFQEKLKDGVDPNGIISPGRYGLWPAGLRNNRA